MNNSTRLLPLSGRLLLLNLGEARKDRVPGPQLTRPLGTYLDSVPQVLPKHKRLLWDWLFFLTAVLLGSVTRLGFLGLFLLVNKTTTEKGRISAERAEPPPCTSFAHCVSCGEGP